MKDEMNLMPAQAADGTATKRCTKCGREQPITAFHKYAKAKDGLQSYCKECQYEARIERCAATYTPKRVTKRVSLNSELAKFQSRELIAELRARGYRGELKYTQTITV